MVGIIIPAHNSTETIRDTLNSLVSQTKKIFFTYIIDDCSDDYELLNNIVKEYQQKLKIKLIRNKTNLGPGLTRQIGLEEIYEKDMLDYVMFVDSDDILYPRAVEVLYRMVKKEDADFASGNIRVEIKGGGGRVLDCSENLTWMHGKIYKVAYLKQNHIEFTKKARMNEDGGFNLVCYHLTEKKNAIDETVYLWRDNKNSLTRRETDFFSKYYLDFILIQCEAIATILEQSDKENLSALTASIMTLYRAEQSSNDSASSDTQEEEQIKLAISSVLNHPNIYKVLCNKESITTLIKEQKTIGVINQRIFFFKQNFNTWLDSYNKEISNQLGEVEI